MDAFLVRYLVSWLAFCVLAIVLFVKDVRVSWRAQARALMVPWRLALFAPAILFAKTRGFFGGTKYVSLAHWSSALAGHPVFFFSDLETARAASLAAERLPRFVQIQRRYGGQPGWRFLVKLGYTIDGAREALDREHLWFDVHNLEGERVEATCLNQPHRVSALREGLRGTHELSRLSGFTILCPQGSFDAERIDVLERALSR